MDNRNRPVRMFMHTYDRVPRSVFPGAQPTQEAGDARRLQADKSPEQMRGIRETYLEHITRHDPKNG